jgi:hypothetical protein
MRGVFLFAAPGGSWRVQGAGGGWPSPWHGGGLRAVAPWWEDAQLQSLRQGENVLGQAGGHGAALLQLPVGAPAPNAVLLLRFGAAGPGGLRSVLGWREAFQQGLRSHETSEGRGGAKSRAAACVAADAAAGSFRGRAAAGPGRRDGRVSSAAAHEGRARVIAAALVLDARGALGEGRLQLQGLREGGARGGKGEEDEARRRPWWLQRWRCWRLRRRPGAASKRRVRRARRGRAGLACARACSRQHPKLRPAAAPSPPPKRAGGRAPSGGGGAHLLDAGDPKVGLAAAAAGEGPALVLHIPNRLVGCG